MNYNYITNKDNTDDFQYRFAALRIKYIHRVGKQSFTRKRCGLGQKVKEKPSVLKVEDSTLYPFKKEMLSTACICKTAINNSYKRKKEDVLISLHM